jgi:hypothetical protein
VESAEFPHLEDRIQPVYANYLEFFSIIESSLLSLVYFDLFIYVFTCISVLGYIYTLKYNAILFY